MPDGVVFNVQRYSIHDGPGIRTTVFLKGCPLSCLWCCNPESQERGPEVGAYPSSCIRCGSCVPRCPSGALAVGDEGPDVNRGLCRRCGECAAACSSGGLRQIGRGWSVDTLMETLEADRFFYDSSGGGITLSGGEPTMQPEFSRDLLRACVDAGFHTAMESCGYALWDTFSSLLPHLDLVLFDLKQIDSARHRDLTGVPNERILDNARRVAASGVEMIVRTPVVPGCNDDTASLEALAEFVAGLGRVREWHLLPYHRLGAGKYGSLGKASPFDYTGALNRSILEDAAALAARRGITVQIGG